ncbi:uncharacterized protein LOC129789813 [Lutzomyia longipalpis]|uniref:uncharacterized protein LOC129789813 n=1 Tax=Lutzomyia longipalpis TaxID=7200 RepID=UPI002484414F|nr:uncharacterized protein LOC129789813 [Lutzomyia longipalpis]
MEDNDIFVNLKYGDQIELTDVISTNEGFPSYEDFIESAQRTFDITHPIYFANQVNARLREKIFEKYVKKFLNNSDFILYVKDEDPLNKKDDSRAGPSTSISSNINRSRNSLQSVNQNSPKSVESDSLAYEEVTMQEVLHIDVVPKQEPMQDVLPEIVLIENNIPEKPDSSSMQNFASTSDFDSMPLKNRKRPVPLDRDSIRNPNNFNMEKMTANDLRNYIYESGGQNIFHEYERDGTLCEASRKQFIRIVAQHLTANFGFYSGKETKIAYAKLCVQLLPKYKTSSGVNYDFFYDPTTTRGALGDKLHYLQSKCRRQGNGVYLTKKRREAQQAEMSASAASKQKIDEETALANIEFIKNATIQDKDQIIQAFKANREHRLVNSNTIVDDYINAFRLVPSLLISDFEYTYGERNVLPYWNHMQESIDSIYMKNTRKKNVDDVILEWAVPVQTILKILSFLPPGNKGTLKNTLESLIMFFRSGTSIDTIQTSLNALERNVQIYAVGMSKKKISSFHLKIDDLFLRVSNNAYEALDTFVKIHFSLNIEYSKLHCNFLKFLQHYVYKIPIQETSHSMKSLALELQIE